MDRGPVVTASVARVQLKPKEDIRIRNGHLWAFSNELAPVAEVHPAGSILDLYDSQNGFVGRGFYHPHSLIAFRIVSRQREPIDVAFWTRQFKQALAFRQSLYGESNYRLIFGESDGFPGLLIDRYNDVVVLQSVSAGIDACRDDIVAALESVVNPKAIVWRTDANARTLEGLPEKEAEVLKGNVPSPLIIETENGHFAVDVLSGQKTGFYYDQRDNRQTVASYAKGKRMLDAFCYSGGFGIAAARAGAAEVVFVDESESALALAKDNVERNGLTTQTHFVEGRALSVLEDPNTRGHFDIISIDPPAFARTKKHLPVALKAYEKLNAAAISALPRGGILVSSSCSHHVTRELFMTMLKRATFRAKRQLRLIEMRAQAKDHPILLAMPETEYLKCAILQVL